MTAAAITGAYGYLGSRLRAELDAAGWRTVALVRSPRPGDGAYRWQLGDPLPPECIGEIDTLVHCAYDMTVRSWNDIVRINVAGTDTVLNSAAAGGVQRVLVLSSMSAYPGTRQLYGRAKLEIEALTLRAGGIAIRPGLVYGADSGGMVGTLRKLVALPITPVIAGSARQYPVLEDELARAVREILEAPTWKSEMFGIAQPSPVTFRHVLEVLARQSNTRCRFVPVPWQLVRLAVTLLERVRPNVGIRSDSLLGLVRPAPFVPQASAFPHLLDNLTAMS